MGNIFRNVIIFVMIWKQLCGYLDTSKCNKKAYCYLKQISNIMFNGYNFDSMQTDIILKQAETVRNRFLMRMFERMFKNIKYIVLALKYEIV